MIIINKIITLTKITSYFYLVILFYFFTLNKCSAEITTNDVYDIVKKSIEEQANLEYLTPYKKLILTTLEELFDQRTGKFLFQKYKIESQKIRTSIKESYTTLYGIGNIPIGPETLQARYVIYDIISHKVFLGLIINFLVTSIDNSLTESKLRKIISQHDITKLNYIEGYQQLHTLLANDYKTAKKLIDANPDSEAYRAMHEHKCSSSHHPRYWWEIKKTDNIPNKYLIEMFADHLSLDLHRGGEQKTISQKIDHYKEYLAKNKFDDSKELKWRYLLMKKLFNYAEKIQIKYRDNPKNFGCLIGLID